MSITFSLIQTQLFWENKAANLEMLENKILSINTPTQIVVLPEMFSTGFSMKPTEFGERMDGHTIDWMQKIAIKKRIILTGSIIIEEDGKYYNRLIWMQPNGECSFYNKRHCFAYAGENLYYTPGSNRLIVQANGFKINVQVCYDLRFPVWARQTPSTMDNTAAYDILLYVANWPKSRSHAWKTLLTARAIENQSFVIGVNRVGNDGNQIYHSGDSMVIDPLGAVLYHKEDVEDIFTITLNKEDVTEVRQRFPFWKDADSFNITNS